METRDFIARSLVCRRQGASATRRKRDSLSSGIIPNSNSQVIRKSLGFFRLPGEQISFFPLLLPAFSHREMRERIFAVRAREKKSSCKHHARNAMHARGRILQLLVRAHTRVRQRAISFRLYLDVQHPVKGGKGRSERTELSTPVT